MSWIDKLNNDLIITTGDGKEYKPLWKRPTKSVAFNNSEFAFPNLSGSLVVRGTPMGRRFPLELYFVGDNHLEQSEAFEFSANDKRVWRIEHPYYGLIFVQPTEINFDNTGDNITKININVIETITDDNPKSITDPIDNIKITKVQLDSSFENNITATIQSTDINTMNDINTKNYNLTTPIITIPSEAEEFYNLFNQASAAINTAVASPVLAMRATMAALSYPANLSINVQDRINTLISSFNNLRATVSGLTNVSSKQIYQIQAGTILSSMALASATPLTVDYTNSKGVLAIVDLILTSYSQYLTDLDSLQSQNGGNTTSFIPSQDSLTTLDLLISFTIANLYNIALNSRVERTIITESDTNIIILTHRFYGLDPSDDNINEFFINNGLGLNHILLIQKGTKIIYYI